MHHRGAGEGRWTTRRWRTGTAGASFFSEYIGPTLVKMYRAGEHLTSSQLNAP